MKVNAVRVFLIALLISSPALADSSSPNLAAYYDRQMAIVGGQIYAWKGRNPPKAISVTAHQVGGGVRLMRTSLQNRRRRRLHAAN